MRHLAALLLAIATPASCLAAECVQEKAIYDYYNQPFYWGM